MPSMFYTVTVHCSNDVMFQWWSVDGRQLQTYYLKGQFPKFLRVNDSFSTFVTVDDTGYLYILQAVQVE